jgi:predicted permease
VVIGVMPASFDFASDPDIWMPLAPDPGENRGDHRLMGIARLKPGVGMEQAHADLAAIGARLSELYPDSNGGWSARLERFDQWMIGSQVKQAMYVLLAAVGLLLLIACANVSNLLLARATTRRREIGLRAALGAGRGRLVRQLLVESLVLGLLGAGLGLLLAYWALPLIRGLGPMGIPRIENVELSGVVVLFTFVVSLLTGIVFGLVPAVQVSRGSLQEALQEGGRVAETGSRRLRQLMVVGELALAVMVLIGAGLLINSFQRLQHTDPGFVADGVLTVPVALTGAQYTREMQVQFMTDVFDGIRTLPGVTAVGATNISPFSGGSTAVELTVEGREVLSGEDYPFAAWRAVTPGFFEALEITLKTGRLFSFEEDWGRPRESVIINETLANQLWPGEDPLGKRVGLGRNEVENLASVVGVVGDIVDTQLESDPGPMIFLPYTGGWPWMTLLVRTSGDPALLTAAVREQIWAVDKNLPLPGIAPLGENLVGAVARPRFNMQLMGIFAIVALLLAAIGVYGIMAFSVARRTREIGVRMALGARPGKLVGMVIWQALKVAGLGVALGLIGALWLSRFLETLLYETTPTDVMTYAAVALILLAVAAVAALLPAVRATRVDPKVALTTE